MSDEKLDDDYEVCLSFVGGEFRDDDGGSWELTEKTYQARAGRPSARQITINSLVAALEPFAKQADTHNEQMPDSMFIDDYERDTKQPWQSLAGIRIGDLRRAKAALALVSA